MKCKGVHLTRVLKCNTGKLIYKCLNCGFTSPIECGFYKLLDEQGLTSKQIKEDLK